MSESSCGLPEIIQLQDKQATTTSIDKQVVGKEGDTSQKASNHDECDEDNNAYMDLRKSTMLKCANVSDEMDRSDEYFVDLYQPKPQHSVKLDMEEFGDKD